MAKSSVYIPHPQFDGPLRRLNTRLKGESRRHGFDSVFYEVRRRAAGAAAVGALCGLEWYCCGSLRPFTRSDMTIPGRPIFDKNITELADFLSRPDMFQVENRDLPGLEYPEAFNVLVGHLAVVLGPVELRPVQANLLEVMQQQISMAE